MRLEDQLFEQALVPWHRGGNGHRNALICLLQAEREVLAQKGTGRLYSQVGAWMRMPHIKTN
jgi:hypothetical protein